MAERHDIVLGLKVDDFSRGIKEATANLQKLQEAATNAAATLNRAFSEIKIKVDVTGLTAINSTLESLNATLSKFTGNLNRSISSAARSAGRKTSEEFQSVEAAAGKATASIKSLSNQLSLFDEATLAAITKKNAALKETSKIVDEVASKVKSVGDQGELFSKATLNKTKSKSIVSAEDQYNQEAAALKKLEAQKEAASKAEQARNKLEERTAKSILDRKVSALKQEEKAEAASAQAKIREQKNVQKAQAAEAKKLLAEFNSQIKLNEGLYKKHIKELEKQAKDAAKTANEIPERLLTGLRLGLSRAAGNISVGASPFQAVVTEVTRNLVISASNIGLKPLSDAFKATGKAAAETAKPLVDATAAAGGAGKGVKDLTSSLEEVPPAAAPVGGIFTKLNFVLAATGGALILFGSILDKVGDSITQFALDLANAAGKASISTLQLKTVLEDVNRITGLDVGNINDWNNALKQTQIESGQALDDLTRISTVFLQLEADTKLSKEQLQELVRITAVLATPVFGGLSKALLSIKGALAGNLKAIRDNISIGEDQAQVTQNYIQLLRDQGLSQAAATAQAESTTSAQRVYALLIDRTKGQVDSLTQDTTKLVVANQQLAGSVEVIKQKIGASLEPVLARITTFIKDIIVGFSKLPEPILKATGLFFGLGAVITNVGGKLLKLVGYITLVGLAFKILNDNFTRTIPLIGTSLAGALQQLLNPNLVGPPKPILSIADAFSQLSTVLVNFAKGGAKDAIKSLKDLKGVSATLNIFSKIKSLPTLSVGEAASGIGAGLGTAFSGLITILPTIISYLTSIIKFAAPFALWTAGIYLLVEAFKLLDKELGITSGATEVVSGVFADLTEAVTSFMDAIVGPEMRQLISNFVSLDGAIKIVALGFDILLLAILSGLNLIVLTVSKVARAFQLAAEQTGFEKAAGRWKALADGMDASSEAISRAGGKVIDTADKISESLLDTSIGAEKSIGNIVASFKRLEATPISLDEKGLERFKNSLSDLDKRAAKTAADIAGITGGTIAKIQEELTAEFTQQLEKITKELIPQVGERAASVSQIIANLVKQKNDLISRKNRANGFLSPEDTRALAFAEQELAKMLKTLESLNQQRDTKNPIIPQEQFDELEKRFNKIYDVEKVLAFGKAQNEVYESLRTKLIGLKDEEEKRRREAVDNLLLQQDYLKLLQQAGPEFSKELEAIDRKAFQQKEYVSLVREEDELRKEINKLYEKGLGPRKTEAEVAAITNEIARLKKEVGDTPPITADGLVDPTVADTFKKIRALEDELFKDNSIKFQVGLDDKERKRLEDQLKIIEGRKRKLLLGVQVDSRDLDLYTEKVKASGKELEDLANKFTSDINNSSALLGIAENYNKDLEKGVGYAEQQRKIREKQLEVEQALEVATQNALRNLKGDDLTKALKAIEDIRNQSGVLLKVFNDTSVQENANKVKQALKESSNELEDQIKLLKIRDELFSEGLLRGDFNKAQERVDFLTGALDNLNKKLLEYKRTAEETPSPINDEAVAKTEAQIERIKVALRNANFVNDIREILQVIPDALSEALTEGVRGVLDGTQKISDLFRKMAQNILLSISKIFADKAIKGIGDKLSGLAETIANSDIAKKIAASFGIDIGKPLEEALNKPATPQEKLTSVTDAAAKATEAAKEATEKNTVSLNSLRDSVDALLRAIGLLPAKLTPVDNTNTPIKVEDIKSPPIDLQALKSSIETGARDLTDATDEVIGDWFQTFDDDVISGFDESTTQAQTSVGNFCTTLTKELDTGLVGTFTDLVTSIQNGTLDARKAVSIGFGLFNKYLDKILEFFGINTPKTPTTPTTVPGTSKIPGSTVPVATATDPTTILNATLVQTNILLEQINAKLGAGIPQTPGTPFGGGPQPTDIPNSVSGPLTDQSSSEIFDQWSQDFVAGFEQTINETIPDITDSITQFFDDFDLGGGFEELGTEVTNYSQEFFDLASGVFQDGFDSIATLFTQGGGGDGIFSTIIGGIGSLFGFGIGAAGGGLIPGQPSSKDDQIKPVASGEYITNSKAVQYYGADFFDALNNMRLPQNFTDNLQAISANSALSSMTPQITPIVTAGTTNEGDRNVSVTVINNGPRIDPASFKMKKEEVTQIFVDGVRKDRVIRKVLNENNANTKGTS